MLRLLALAMLTANLLYFGWSMGWLDTLVGIRATGDREPERMARQVRPELVVVEGAASAAGAPAESLVSKPDAAAAPPAVPAPPARAASTSVVPPVAKPASVPDAAAAGSAAAPLCLEAGPFPSADLQSAEKMLKAAWAEGAWTRRRIEGNGEWLIYMGPYPDDDGLDRKKGELSRIRGGLPYEVVNAPPQLAHGISLGRFASQAAAEQRLDQLRQRGIRTARVVKAGNGPDTTMLQVARADTATAARLAAVKWPSGKAGVTPCPKPP